LGGGGGGGGAERPPDGRPVGSGGGLPPGAGVETSAHTTTNTISSLSTVTPVIMHTALTQHSHSFVRKKIKEFSSTIYQSNFRIFQVLSVIVRSRNI